MPLPPLVAPAEALPDDERLRTARQLLLPELGELAQRRLSAARVAVLGAGGIGSPVLLYLSAAGVGTIGIVDDDVVDPTNLQRQIAFGADDVGRPKTTAAAERLRALSPRTEVVEHRERLTPENAERLLAGYDLVVDGSDDFGTRYAVADACTALGLPLVWGSVLRFDAQATVFWSRPPAGAAVTLRDVFPEPPPPGEVPSCAEAGVLGALCGQLGGLLAGEAVKLICGTGESLLGRMLLIDALGARVREVPLRPVPRPAESSAAPRLVAVEDLDALAGAALLDVREPEEFARGSIPGAGSAPLRRVLDGSAGLPAAQTVVVFCQEGPRARSAVRALSAGHPHADIRLLDGGYAAWAARARTSQDSAAQTRSMRGRT